MATKRRILRPEDEITHEELMEERRNYTDEQARKLGYPSAEVLQLSDRLGSIAGEWRTTKDRKLVMEYQQTLYEMILKGYDVNTLPIQDQLPAEWMPDLPPPPVIAAILQAYDKLITTTTDIDPHTLSSSI